MREMYETGCLSILLSRLVCATTSGHLSLRASLSVSTDKNKK